MRWLLESGIEPACFATLYVLSLPDKSHVSSQIPYIHRFHAMPVALRVYNAMMVTLFTIFAQYHVCGLVSVSMK